MSHRIQEENYIEHHGILGMKWGVRRFQPYPKGSGPKGTFKGKPSSQKVSGFKNKMAQRSNRKVDEGFEKWNTGAENRSSAIEKGKTRNINKMDLKNDYKNKDLKKKYKESNKDYKTALKKNTTYRKGQVKKEVGSDLARKYLSEAKKIQKKLETDPNNKNLLKEHKKLMGDYNTSRAKARRAPEVAAKRSAKIASLKRARTMTIKAAVTGATITVGTSAVNSYLKSQGQRGLDAESISNAIKFGKKIAKGAGYF